MTSSTHGSFWEHLDALRGCLLRSVVVVVGLAIVLFCMKGALFDIILAPSHGDFLTYRLLGIEQSGVSLINTGLATQFSTHLSAAFAAGLVVGSPWVLRELFCFVRPALYQRERHYALRLTVVAYALFMVGALTSYFVVFPMVVHFFGDYQVSSEVPNLISLQSYMDSLMSTTLVLGIMFELPAVCWLLGRFGIVSAQWLRRYRRHALVAIMVLAAIITPPDVMSLCLVTLPIYLLYELSIAVVKYTNKVPSE